ncbi:hypothetical protein LTR08_005749 [Meristemomyces frigidus]|nr:hypothetical protein LTR08_005749 [Meristemomyces frigidus]
MTPWVSAPILGIGDFCANTSINIDLLTTPNPFGDEPTGVGLTISWDVAGSGLKDARNTFINISTNVSQLTAYTLAWQDRLHHGKELHQSMLEYRSKHHASQRLLDVLYMNHTNFIHSLMLNVGFLGIRIDEYLGSYVRILLDAWPPFIPGLRPHSPLSMMTSDIRVFAKRHINKLQLLEHQAQHLVEALGETEPARDVVAVLFHLEWTRFEEKCLKEKPRYFDGLLPWGPSTVPQEPYCFEWNPDKLRRRLQDDVGGWPDSLIHFTDKSITGYHDLMVYFSTLVARIDDGETLTKFKPISMIGFRMALQNVENEMLKSNEDLRDNLGVQYTRL